MESSKIAIDKVSLPSLGIGTWSWGDRLFWGYGSDYGETEVARAFEAAVANGATFFDTAEVYGLGESERLLGRFLKRTSQPVQIATKYFPLPWRFNRQAVADTLSDSLKTASGRSGSSLSGTYALQLSDESTYFNGSVGAGGQTRTDLERGSQ